MSDFPSPSPWTPWRQRVQETTPSAEDAQSNAKNSETASFSPGSCSVENALDQINRILHQMLLLAELSASNANVDRAMLQRVLDRMKAQIDQIADSMENI